jgi:SWI/SNF-related matrix-associated actin-dependent regulator 1 of chromatin subfamily A
MKLLYHKKRGLFWVRCTFDERYTPIEAGFTWHEDARKWTTNSPYTAATLLVLEPDTELGDGVWDRVGEILKTYRASKALDGPEDLRCPVGEAYLPYQRGGIHRGAMEVLDRNHFLLGDEMGLGKTVQAIGICNVLRYRDPLIVCPASLRVNWARELEKWHVGGPPPYVITKSSDDLFKYEEGPCVVSYEMVSKPALLLTLMLRRFDLVISDEGQYLKNPDALRTLAVLGGRIARGIHAKGLAKWVGRSITMSGTIAPNHVSEIHPIAYALRPRAIGGRGARSFEHRWLRGYTDGTRFVPTGLKHPKELSVHLRGSGFFLRRKKAQVLKDLPPKRFSLLAFPPDKAIVQVLKKEREFDPEEIVQFGPDKVNLHSQGALSTLRKEMGLAKVKTCLTIIKDMLASIDKLVVFAWHQEVVESLHEGLSDFGAVKVYGPNAKSAQANVDAFQTDPECRVIVGNMKTLGTGHTLTASSHVVFVEPDWVPGVNDQCFDRIHRIGQKAAFVNGYLLVAEGSLDAYILSRSATKARNLAKVFD